MSSSMIPLSAAERQQRIAELVAAQGRVHVQDLSELLEVSEVTIRSDLQTLASEGYLLRTHGGAIAIPRDSLVSAFEKRSRIQQEEKRSIGSAAAKLIVPGDIIILDAGTTVTEMAKHLLDSPGLTVVTNALNIATYLGGEPSIRVILVGGALDRRTIATAGREAVEMLDDLRVTKAFLGVHAVNLEDGLTDTSSDIAQLKRAMADSADQVILLADSSKWGKRTLAKVLPLSKIHIFVTDSNLPTEAQHQITNCGVELILTNL